MIAGGGEVASHYVQPHVGGDVAFIVGVAKCLLNNNGVESLFISQHTEGFEAYRDFIEQTQWQDIVRESGVDQETIFEISKIYQASQATVMAWGMGLTHHYNGSENIEAVIALALLRGMVGGPGKGLLPLRGHSNVQGVSTVGLTPAIKSQVMTALEQELGIALPAEEGMDTLACVQAAAAGQIDFALLLGGNLYSANPDSRFSAQALDRIPFKVMLNSTLNETHLNGVEGENLILPVRVRDEEKQATTQESMFNFVRLSDGGFDRLPALRSEVELIAGLAEQVVSASTLKFSNSDNIEISVRSSRKLYPALKIWRASTTARQSSTSRVGTSKHRASGLRHTRRTFVFRRQPAGTDVLPQASGSRSSS